MRPWKRTFLVTVVLLTILSLVISACGPLDNSGGGSDNGKDKDKVHGSDKDKGNGKDNGKEKDQDKAGKADKILICHKTGSAKNPYVQISVANTALKDGHGAHVGDIVPAPEQGCPDTWIAADPPAK